MSRRQSLNYDEVLDRQRSLIYATRNQLLDGTGMDEEKLLEIAEGNIRRFLQKQPLTLQALHRFILDQISYRLDGETHSLLLEDEDGVREYLMKRVRQGLEEQRTKTGSQSKMNRFMRVAALRTIDETWVEQVDYLQQTQAAVSGRTIAQRNPMFEYQKDGLEAFEKMKLTVLENIMRNILLSNVYTDGKDQLHILFP